MKINFETKIIAQKHIYFNEINSTNDYIKQNLTHLPNGLVVFSMNQTNGHGSKGRQWHCTKNQSLAFSILFKNVNKLFLETSTIMAAVTAIKCFENLNIKNSKIKWFNDITISDKKVAGILGESQIQGDEMHCILGIGINISQPQQHFLNLKLPFAGSIFSQTGKMIQPLTILKQFIQTLEINLLKPKTILFNHYTNLCYTINKKIKFVNTQTNHVDFGIAKKILPDGKLLIAKNDTFVKIDHCNYSIFHV